MIGHHQTQRVGSWH